MRTGSALINASLPNEVTTLARIWKISPAIGGEFDSSFSLDDFLINSPLRFTDHDQDILFASEVYSSEIGFTATTIVSATNSIAQGVELTLPLDDEITAVRISAGYFDNATCVLSLIDYETPTNGVVVLFGGTIGNIKLDNLGQVVFSIKGIFSRERNILVESYSPLCRADLGDSRCTFNIESLKVLFTVTSLANSQTIVSTSLTQADFFWKFGTLHWLTGNNAGIAAEVATSDQSSTHLQLFLPTPFPIQVGDTAEVYPGCDKTVAMCHTRYNNILNFRGEPYTVNDDGLDANYTVPTPTSNVKKVGVKKKGGGAC